MRVTFPPDHCRNAGTGTYYCSTSTSGPDALDPFKGIGEQPSCSVGNPIYPTSRNKYQSETDYAGPGASALVFRRFFNSLEGFWRHSYSRRISFRGKSKLFMKRDDGRGLDFALVQGSWYPWDDVDYQLSYDSLADEWTLVTENDEVEV